MRPSSVRQSVKGDAGMQIIHRILIIQHLKRIPRKIMVLYSVMSVIDQNMGDYQRGQITKVTRRLMERARTF